MNGEAATTSNIGRGGATAMTVASTGEVEGEGFGEDDAVHVDSNDVPPRSELIHPPGHGRYPSPGDLVAYLLHEEDDDDADGGTRAAVAPAGAGADGRGETEGQAGEEQAGGRPLKRARGAAVGVKGAAASRKSRRKGFVHTIRQAVALSNMAPRLSSGVDPFYPEMGTPPAPLGVVLEGGTWALHTGEEAGGIVRITKFPGVDAPGRLKVVRAAEEADIAHILERAFQWPSTYETDTELVSTLPSPNANTVANARYASWVTSIAGAHIRCPIGGGPLWHHCVDTGDGTVIHYSLGEVRLDPLFAIVGRDCGPVEAVRRAADPQATISRAVTRLGERHYCPASNNCEHFAWWATQELHESQQVAATSLAVGCLAGTAGGLALALSAPLWAVPALGIGGAAFGGMMVHRAVTRRAKEVSTRFIKEVCGPDEVQTEEQRRKEEEEEDEVDGMMQQVITLGQQ